MSKALEPVTAQMSVPLSFIHAKLRGRRRRVYEKERLEELEQKRRVRELWEEFFPRQRASGRVALERRLREKCARELCSFDHLLPADVADFYRALLRRFQVDNILVLLRLFAGGREEAEPSSYMPELPDQLALSSGEFLGSSDLEEFIERIPPQLAGEVAPTVELYEEYGTTAFTEMALERAWWLEVLEKLQKLPRRHRYKSAAPLLSELGSDRLLAVLRAGRNYEIDWEDIQPMLPPGAPDWEKEPQVRLSDQALEELFEDASPERIAARLHVERSVAGSLIDLEEQMWERTFRLANRIYYSVMEGPSIVVCYFYIRRNELKNLVKTVESVHYSR
jgi:vacuolar-type H+-ATPase subunit C/Vma6